MLRYLLAFILTVTLLSCSGEEIFSDVSVAEQQQFSPKEKGVMNAVKKAYQLTDIVFTPLQLIEANSKKYVAGNTYQGVIYSSVKEIGTYVGSNVSFHTFMTAIHNPRSKIYTERINEAPYHGVGGRAYYGTVCSGLVSYALGLDYGSYDFPVSELMEEVDYSNIDNIRVADVLWVKGHVAIITDVVRDEDGHVKNVEISEAVQAGCRRYSTSRDNFIKLMSKSFESIHRYKEIEKNTEYTPAPDFVAVMDEVPVPFIYNDDLCADKGDKACYLENEDVIINIMRDYVYLEVYKGDELYLRVDSTSGNDVVLHNLSYGDYRARICYGETNTMMSDFTRWKVVNIELIPDRANNRLYFNSANAMPYKINFASLNGGRTYPHTQLFSRILTEEDRVRGFLDIPQNLTKEKYPYIHFCFSTEYGKIENMPINWFK